MTNETSGLVIPISLEALCINDKDDVNVRGASVDFSKLPYYDDDGNEVNLGPAIGDTLAEPVSTNWQAGVHLHWALPDALTHGQHDNTTGQTSYPPAPNRWLVTRMVVRNKTVTAHKFWVIESDQLNKTDPRTGIQPKTTTVPVYPEDYYVPQDPAKEGPEVPATSQPYRYLGRVYIYQDWQEGQGAEYLNKNRHYGSRDPKDEKYTYPLTTPYKLSAVAYGNATFAGHYADSCSVFGFHDPVADLGNNYQANTDTLSYHVVGWYSDPKDDQLHSPHFKSAPPTKPSLEAMHKQEKVALDYAAYQQVGPHLPEDTTVGAYRYRDDLQWLATGSGADPSYSLYTGQVIKVAWQRETAFFTSESEAKPAIAVGNTALEAMSALVANKVGPQSGVDLEKILNALQLGLLDRLDEPGGRADYDQALHQSYFGSDQGGTRWRVIRKDDDEREAKEVPLTSDQASKLHALNEAQMGYDALVATIQTEQQQIFADWCKYQDFERPTNDDVRRWSEATEGVDYLLQQLHHAPDDGRNYILAEIKTLIAKQKELDPKTTGSQAHTVAAKKAALISALGQDYELVEGSAPRYWHANEPVLMLAGDKITPAIRYGGDGRLRQDSYLECRLTSEILTGTALLTDTTKFPSAYQQAIADLVAEAGQVAEKGAIPSASGTKKSPSEIGFKAWSQPWLPILLDWQAHCWPLQALPHDQPSATYATDLISKHYQLDHGQTDLAPPADSTYKGHSQAYANTVILSHRAGPRLQEALDTYLEIHSETSPITKALKKVQSAIKDLPVLAQTLGGFNLGLLMRHQGLQWGVADSFCNYDDDPTKSAEWQIWHQTRAVVGDMNDSSPLAANHYSPLRTGYLTLPGLTLIDAFGRMLELDTSDLVFAKSLKPTNTKLMIDGRSPAMLPPRIAQPNRLRFEWLSAASDIVEYTDHPSSSPICGWVLFNHLDHSLVVYDQAGVMLGALYLSNDEAQVIWHGAPGTATWNKTIAQVCQNTHLQTFIQTIDTAGATYLKSLLLTINRSLTTTLPQNAHHDTSTAMLMSRPLALVRARLSLDIQGTPAHSQSWESFQNAVQATLNDSTHNADKKLVRPTKADFQKVTFPIQLGHLTNINDGLVGYMIGSDNGHFYAAAADGSSTHITKPTMTTLLLDSEASSYVDVSMLVDPRAKIHATTGIVPRQSLEVPPDEYAQTLKRMALTVLSAPILSGPNEVSFPVPKEGGGHWSWLTQGSNQIWTEVAQIAPVNQQATTAHHHPQINEGWLKYEPHGEET